MPREVFPHTLHSDVGDRDSSLRVKFLQEDRLVLRKQDRVIYNSTGVAEYRFSSPEELQRFQEELRGKDLVYRFEFDKLRSKRSLAVEAENQDLKIWRGRDPHRRHSLSFYGSKLEKRYLEFPVSWFDSSWFHKTMDRKKATTTVQLNFIQRNASTQVLSRSRRRIPSIKRTLSVFRSNSAGDFFFLAV